jgi:putative ABC transport system permease protein
MGGRLPVQTITLLARTSSEPGAAAIALRAVLREADERLVAETVMPLEQRLLTTLAQPRLYAALLGGFAAFALIIAAVGLFGLVSYTVSLRSRELAIRMALGACRADIFRVVLGQGLAVTLAGLVAGLIASAWAARLLATHLYGVATHDPLTFVLVPLMLLTVGALACLIAARRAASLDPRQVLRGT